MPEVNSRASTRSSLPTFVLEPEVDRLKDAGVEFSDEISDLQLYAPPR